MSYEDSRCPCGDKKLPGNDAVRCLRSYLCRPPRATRLPRRKRQPGIPPTRRDCLGVAGEREKTLRRMHPGYFFEPTLMLTVGTSCASLGTQFRAEPTASPTWLNRPEKCIGRCPVHTRAAAVLFTFCLLALPLVPHTSLPPLAAPNAAGIQIERKLVCVKHISALSHWWNVTPKLRETVEAKH